ncbi:Cytochrome c oxidase subunit VIa [Plasmodiophora brassicae]|uniref:Uncharacterized protein n=1 Tax=Plasmodiophora brassicae TaxID=37360 RepID=A0A0G4J640_PLABS|nr:hypothetical protein PBRA_002801 [Plasmodiophora brassicae]SPQ94941.1 unnamed protein product [Plasmodiophora brassicae]
MTRLGKLLFGTAHLDPGSAMWKRITMFFGFPLVGAYGAYVFAHEMSHEEHFEKPDLAYLNIRKKAFPWKHGDVCSLFDKHCKEKVAAQEAGENWKTAWHHKGDDSEAAAGHGH